MSSEHAMPPDPLATHSASSLNTGDLESDPASRAPWNMLKLDPYPQPLTEGQQRILDAVPLSNAAAHPGTICTAAALNGGLLDRAAVDAAPEKASLSSLRGLLKDTPRVIFAEEEPADPLRDALSHIAKTAAASRSQSRRVRWIRARAEGALAGIPYNAGDFELPKMSLNSAEKLAHKNRHLRVELARLKDAAQALLDKVNAGDGSSLNAAAGGLAALLATAGTGLEADPPNIELLEWTDADSKPDADISYLLEVLHDDGSTECFYGWWDDEVKAWLADVDGGQISGTVLRYSDPRGLGA